MKLPSIFSNRRFSRMAIAVAIFGLIFLAINIFVIGGDKFIFSLNSSINFPLAVIVTILGASMWRSMSKDKVNRVLWTGLLIGWALWALAEAIWTIYSISGKDVPYPSVADFFWAIGYIPMGIGLIARSRTMPVRPNRRQNIFIIILSAATILITFFLILLPTFQSFDNTRIAESLLNIIYPVGDLFLLIVVWRLFFTYEEGDYGFGWMLITLGFIFNSVADSVFTYSTWQGLYYPDMKANLISRLGADVPYTFSYLLWLVGIYALSNLLKKKEEAPLEVGPKVRLVRTYGNILVYTGRNDTVMSVSPNFNRFFEARDIEGKSLADTLNISKEEAQSILEKLRNESKLANLPIKIRNRSGDLQDVKIFGLAVFGPQKAYKGSNILIRMRTPDTFFDSALSEETRGLVRYMEEKSEDFPKAEVAQFLSDYYLTYLRSLLEMTFHQGGDAAGQALLDHLSHTTQAHNWQMQFNLKTVLVGSDYPLEVLREALPVLLEAAKEFVSEITSPADVEARLKKVSSRFSDTVLHDVEYYEQAQNEIGFADHRKGPVKSGIQIDHL